jgi:hypothetical protein
MDGLSLVEARPQYLAFDAHPSDPGGEHVRILDYEAWEVVGSFVPVQDISWNSSAGDHNTNTDCQWVACDNDALRGDQSFADSVSSMLLDAPCLVVPDEIVNGICAGLGTFQSEGNSPRWLSPPSSPSVHTPLESVGVPLPRFHGISSLASKVDPSHPPKLAVPQRTPAVAPPHTCAGSACEPANAWPAGVQVHQLNSTPCTRSRSPLLAESVACQTHGCCKVRLHSSDPPTLFHQYNDPAAATMALLVSQANSLYRGPGRFAKGTCGSRATRTRKPLSERRSEEGPLSDRQPHWIMDQIYLLLTSFHVVIQPFALKTVTRRTRTIRDMFRFVNSYTMRTLGLFQKLAPEFFTNIDPQIFPVELLYDVLCALLNVALAGAEGVTWNFHWDNFHLSGPFEYEFIIRESLRGVLATRMPVTPF